MRKAAGLFAILVLLCAAAYGWQYWVWSSAPPDARSAEFSSSFLSLPNARNVLTWTGLFGILALGQAVVIITGGIDLSVGSVVGLTAVVAAMLLDRGEGWHPLVALPLCFLMTAAIGATHGLLITKLRLQPFVVTLCGLFIYRGISRTITADNTQGFGSALPRLKWFGNGSVASLFPPPEDYGSTVYQVANALTAPFLLVLLAAAAMAAYLHFSVQGRHLFALGANEEAARFSGIPTARLQVYAYILCSMFAGLGGLLFAFKVNSVGPSDFGSFYELYAIAGAVLGGCSLRGGSGNVLGIVLGIALIVTLRNVVNLLGIPSQLEYVVIGGAILLGLGADELLTPRHLKQR